MKNTTKKILLSVLALALVAVMALGLAACGNKADEPDTTTPPQTEAPKAEDVTEVGNGQKSFAFEVKDKDGSVTKYLVKTDADNVGQALLDAKLVSGETSEYGLMVDTVNGVKLDFNADKMYWGFFINDEMAMTGVSQTAIDETAVYSLVATAA